MMSKPNLIDTLIVCESLTEEHRKVELLLDALESCIASVRQATASKETHIELGEIFSLIVKEINVHFACEEQCLFPVLSKYHPMVLMEVEHEELIELKDKLEEAYHNSQESNCSDEAVVALGQQFISYLRDHIAREDKGIFPMAERDLSHEEKQFVIHSMDALRERSKTEFVPAIIRSPKQFSKIRLNDAVEYNKPIEIQRLLETDNTAIKQINLKQGESLAPHWSPNQIFLFCLSGAAQFESEGQTEILEPGVGIFMDPRLMHSVLAKEDTRILLIAFQCGQAARCKKQHLGSEA